MPRKKAAEGEKPERKPKAPKPNVRAKAISMDEVYRLINRVQTNRKEVQFLLTPDDAVIANNVIRDLDLKFERKDLKSKVSFTIFPNPEEDEDEKGRDVIVDFFADEIPEDGQLF